MSKLAVKSDFKKRYAILPHNICQDCGRIALGGESTDEWTTVASDSNDLLCIYSICPSCAKKEKGSEDK